MAAELLRHGADPNAVEHVHGQTPLHLSAIQGPGLMHSKTTRLFLSTRARQGNAEMAKLLLDHGADPKLADVYGNSFNDIATAVGTPISPTKLREVLGM